ncbi:uncharacterized protein LOC130100257 [Rhinichthys klamathensis goyatoka]|uniref:uncharacterized protein LOC130100257 n=1 Tax=Rhinichthys klamathensis goyatoka TaxID=3034132 RepID=UPI0024B5DB3A|nr:uncharacterized protein LOC130100257 [Rhinichthys klamathensis goyatoka]
MWIEEEQISTMDEMLPPSVRPVTGISSTHQVLSFAPGKILYRDLSCFCQYPVMCTCHKLHQLEFDHVFPDEVPGDKTSDDGGPSAEVPSVQPSWPTTDSRAHDGGSATEVPSSPSSLPTREPQAHSSTQVLFACAQSSASIGEAQAEDSDTISNEGYTEGQFVLIKYEGKPNVGQIVAISMEGLQVNCIIHRGDKNSFVWPNRRDCIYYQDQEIVCGLSQPQQGSRFATLSKFDWLMYNGV